MRDRIAEYGRALADACAASARCIDDGGALNRYRPSAAQISALDGFHPSVAGQHELAALEWSALDRSRRAEALLD